MRPSINGRFSKLHQVPKTRDSHQMFAHDGALHPCTPKCLPLLNPKFTIVQHHSTDVTMQVSGVHAMEGRRREIHDENERFYDEIAGSMVCQEMH